MDSQQLREKAAKCLGWHPEFGCGQWRPDERHDQAALLLAEVERRGKQDEFVAHMRPLVCASGLCEELWAFAAATPEQKTRAAVEALENKK